MHLMMPRNAGRLAVVTGPNRCFACGRRGIALLDQRAQDVVIRRGAVCRISGALAGVFGDSYLTTVREDWPA